MRSITAIQADIDSTKRAIDAGGVDQSQVDVWNGQIEGFDEEMKAAEEAQQQDAHVQQQAQAAQIGGLKETLRSIFEAAFPKDETVKVIGLTEYESTQQTFNQLVDQAVDEDQTALYAAFNTQLEQRDEKFRALTSQALDVQNALDKANATIQAQTETIAEHEKTIDKLHNAAVTFENDLHQKDIEIESLGQQLESAKETIFNLQKQINNVPVTPKIIDITPTAPSESLSDKIAAAKVASVTKFSNLYSDVTYTDGTKQVVHNSMLTALEIPVLPPLKQVDSQNVEQSAHTEQVIHPSEENTATHTEGDSSAVGNESVVEVVAKTTTETPTVTYATKEEHEALAARVATIERHANIQAVA